MHISFKVFVQFMHMPRIERHSGYLDENPTCAYYCAKSFLEYSAVARLHSDRVITCLSVGVSRKSIVPRAFEGFRFVEQLIMIWRWDEAQPCSDQRQQWLRSASDSIVFNLKETQCWRTGEPVFQCDWSTLFLSLFTLYLLWHDVNTALFLFFLVIGFNHIRGSKITPL